MYERDGSAGMTNAEGMGCGLKWRLRGNEK